MHSRAGFLVALPICGALALLSFNSSGAEPQAPQAHALVKEDLEAFFDGIILYPARHDAFNFPHSSQPIAPADRVPLTAWCKTAAIYWLGVLITLVVLFHFFEDDSMPPTSEWEKYFLMGDVLLVIAVLMSLGTAVSAWRVWLMPAISRISQVKFTLVACACLYFSWFAIHWHAITPVHRF